MDAAAYIRVSTRQQSLEAQKEVISRAALARGDRITDWYGEKASGSKLERAELAELRAAVRRGEHRKLYVFRVDRLSRGGVLPTFQVVDELNRNGCQVVSVADAFDFEGPTRDIVLAVLAACAQMERLALADRIAAARELADAQGRSWGRPKTLREDTVRIARKMQAAGRAVRSIARELGVSKTTLARALARNSGDPERYLRDESAAKPAS